MMETVPPSAQQTHHVLKQGYYGQCAKKMVFPSDFHYRNMCLCNANERGK